MIDENVPSGGAIAAGTYHMIVVRAGLGLHWVVHGAEGYMDPLEGRWQPLWPQSRRSLFAGPTPYASLGIGIVLRKRRRGEGTERKSVEGAEGVEEGVEGAGKGLSEQYEYCNS